MNLKSLTLAAIGALVLAFPSGAQDLGLSRINVTVPFGEGGGSDTLVRAIAPYLQTTFAGQPAILIRNEPGGGGIPATNRFVQNAEKDGSALISLSSSIFIANVLGNAQIQFTLDDFVPVFVAPLGPVIYISPTTGASGPGDVAGVGTTQLVFGGGRQDSADVLTVMQLDLLDLNVQAVWGLERGGGRIGFERGEFNVDHQTSVAFNASVQPLVDAGTAIPFMTTGIVTPQGNIVRDPIFPDIPTFSELYEKVHGKPLSGPAREAYLALTTAAISAGKTIALPAGVSQAVIDAYAKAFGAVVGNPEFRAATESSLGAYPLYVGDEAGAVFAADATMSEEAYAWLQEWFRNKLNFEISR
jgi:hypothetical protein